MGPATPVLAVRTRHRPFSSESLRYGSPEYGRIPVRQLLLEEQPNLSRECGNLRTLAFSRLSRESGIDAGRDREVIPGRSGSWQRNSYAVILSHGSGGPIG